MSGFYRKYQFLLIFVILVVGCAPGHWVMLKHGHPADPSEIRADSLACERDAAFTYPFAPVVTSKGGGSSGSSYTNCSSLGYSVNCDTYGGGYTAPTVTTSDGNEGTRQRFYKSCMAALGYERIFVPDPRVSTRTDSADSRAARMICERRSDCEAGKDCRSKAGGGTECR